MLHLSMPQSAGQVIVAGFAAGAPPEVLLSLARGAELGGFILFRRNLGDLAEVVELTRTLLAAAPADRPIWIAVDQEGGRVARLGPPVVKLPAMRVLGAIDDPGLTRDAGALLGRQLRLLGFNLDFAPVLDVDTHPDNPVIGDRSFGREPELVIRHARAFSAGLASAQIAACGKHFPGHGDTELDSHFALPRLRHTRERLERVELAPFVALKNDLPCMMTAHVLFDALDANRPATLSPNVVNDLLRRELGFEGLIFSDDLEMKAVADRYGVAQAACLAIEAGCDSVLICSDVAASLAAREALIHKAEKNSVFAAQLAHAAQRSLSLRSCYAAQPAAAEDAERLLLAEGGETFSQRIQAAQKSPA
jgi:beta-N-acetylhexosaminidase